MKSAKRDEEPSSVYALTGWLSIIRVIFGPALGMGSRPTQPSQCTLTPLCSEKAAAGAEDMGSQRESVCGTDREGAEWGGMAPTEGASVVLKERQKVIITIARQVGGVQVREELVRICEFWKELEKKYRSPDEVLAEGLGEECRVTPTPVCLPSVYLPGSWPKRETTSAGCPQTHLGHRAGLGHTNTYFKPNS